MSVYVDQMQVTTPSTRWPFNSSCHLIADTVEELQEFATKLGLHISWFQNKPGGHPHYDLTTRMRQKAYRMGALEISGKRLSKLMHKNRQRVDE